MFFHTKRINGSRLVQPVNSCRAAGGRPLQRVVVSPGDATLPEKQKHEIARTVENHPAAYSGLLPAELSGEAVGRRVRRILQPAARSRSARPVGPQSVMSAMPSLPGQSQHPNFHQLPFRVEAQVFLSVPA